MERGSRAITVCVGLCFVISKAMRVLPISCEPEMMIARTSGLSIIVFNLTKSSSLPIRSTLAPYNFIFCSRNQAFSHIKKLLVAK